jgi:hypothetical protein
MDGSSFSPAQILPRKKRKRADFHRSERLSAMEKREKKRIEDRMLL